MADEDFLQQFRNQLVRWIEQEMETGRLPFRRIETTPPLLTAQPPATEHLVLWINRASVMAGGLLLLPRELAEDVLDNGAALAEAVGLDHFAVWDRQRVSIWQRRPDAIRKLEEWPLGGRQSISTLHRTLRQLLERLKVLSVLQGAGNTTISPWWLVNLLHLCLLDTMPIIRQDLRATTDDRGPGDAPDRTARGKALLVLFRLVALCHAGVLGRGIQPEKLERALSHALDRLPPALRRQLAPAEGEPALPEEAAIRFHHLLHRLQQIEKQLTAPQSAAALRQLLPDLSPLVPPGTCPPPRPPGRWLAVQPLALAGEPPDALVADPPLAAWHSLCAWLEQQPPAAVCVNRLEELPPQGRYDRISANLNDTPAPDSHRRGNLQAMLRLSWPSRRFRLPPSAPVWCYDFIHLLGLAAPEAELHLHLPDRLLQPAIGRPLWELICSTFCCHELRRNNNGTLTMRLQRHAGRDVVCRLENETIRREIAWSLLQQRSLGYLACALDWPDPLFVLLSRNELRLTEEEPPPAGLWREQILFWHSRWGRNLAAWCGFKPARARSIFMEGRTKELPPVYPSPERLEALRNVAWSPDSTLPAAERLDEELAFWLGGHLTDPELPRPNRRRPPRPNALAPTRQGQVAELIRERLLVDGLPQFPEHYLYDHYRPVLKHWTFSGPLQEKERFFATIELQGPSGESIRTDCESLAGCLLLASANRRSTELPTDPQVAADILQRYLHDLVKLRRELLRQCRLETTTAPERLANRLWREWRLPPWNLVRQVAAALFSSADLLE